MLELVQAWSVGVLLTKMSSPFPENNTECMWYNVPLLVGGGWVNAFAQGYCETGCCCVMSCKKVRAVG